MALISKTYRKILVALLAALGFGGVVAGCRELPVEYGAPSGTYKAKGVVVSETDGQTIQGIQAVLGEIHKYYSEEFDSEENVLIEKFYPIGDPVLTSKNGTFTVQGSDDYSSILYVELTDIDGEDNGLYASQTVKADFTGVTFTGGSGWNMGTAVIDLGTIKMQPADTTDSE